MTTGWVLNELCDCGDAYAGAALVTGLVVYYWICGLLRQCGYRLRRPAGAPWQNALTRRAE